MRVQFMFTERLKVSFGNMAGPNSMSATRVLVKAASQITAYRGMKSR